MQWVRPSSKTTPVHDVAGDPPDPLLVPSVCSFQWQWEHRNGFKNYSAEQSERIETAYQTGRSKVRLRAGKGIERPMEIFFRDMIQHDVVTKNQRHYAELDLIADRNGG